MSAGRSRVGDALGTRVMGTGVALLVDGAAVGTVVGGWAAKVALTPAIMAARSARSVAATSAVGDGLDATVTVKVGSTAPPLSTAVVAVGDGAGSLRRPKRSPKK